MIVGQYGLAVKGYHGKEIGAAFYSDSSVIRHNYWCVRRTLRCPTISNAVINVCFLQARIFVENFFNSHPTGQEVQNQRDPNPMSPDARLAEADMGINADPRQQFLSGHMDSPPCSPDKICSMIPILNMIFDCS